MVPDVRTIGESLLAGGDAAAREIDNDELIAQILQKLGPTPVSRRDFQTRTRWDESANSGQNGATPLLLGPAPWLGPIVTSVGPGIVDIPRQPIPFNGLYCSSPCRSEITTPIVHDTFYASRCASRSLQYLQLRAFGAPIRDDYQRLPVHAKHELAELVRLGIAIARSILWMLGRDQAPSLSGPAFHQVSPAIAPHLKP
jgi:hypothetical protein